MANEQKESNMKLKTNFDVYLKEQYKDTDFAAQFKKATKAWDVVIDSAAFKCREKYPDSRIHPVKKLKGNL